MYTYVQSKMHKFEILYAESRTFLLRLALSLFLRLLKKKKNSFRNA